MDRVMSDKLRFAGLSFDHMHMGDNLRMAGRHPEVEVVALCDPEPARMAAAARELGLKPEQLFTEAEKLFDECRPDVVILCPATARHGEWVERVAPFGVHVLIEKPFAANLAEADRMIAAMAPTGKLLAINWPLVWVASHATTKRLIDSGLIGEPVEVHYYDGNRGPLWHVAHKEETTSAWVEGQKPRSWFYRRSHGGGSLLDYLGYGVTLGTWFLNGQVPVEVTTVVDQPAGLEVDEHSVTVCRYARGLSKFETRWGTFTDPWTHQPQPGCGFVIVGTAGTISSYDYAPTVRVQTRARPEGYEQAVDELRPPFQDPVQYLVHCIRTGSSTVEGPLSPAMSRIGQEIVDAAVRSSQMKCTVPLRG